MISKAIGKYIRISPFKTREVIDIVRGKNVDEAVAILSNLNKKAAGIVLKILNSAVANAQNRSESEIKGLYISEIKADQGPVYKRFRPAAMGRAVMIRKRTTHITVKLDVKK